MADDAGGRGDRTKPAGSVQQMLTDITNTGAADASGNSVTDKAGTTDDTQYRPATATPSLQTHASVDSAFEDSDSRSSRQAQHGNQQPQNAGDAPIITTGYEELNITHEQAEGLHHALVGEQLAEEQDLIVDVRRIPRRHRRRRRVSGESSHHPTSESRMTAVANRGGCRESTTTSLSESIWNYRKEHGRTYHAYKDGKYIFPNDEREADRLDLQHHLFRITFANHLYFAPLHSPRRALDVGTGTGIWAMEFADEFPDCDVIGIDLSPGQPQMVPPNCKFIIDDAEDLWVYPEKFDYVHARLMAGCFADWPAFFRQAYENLEPGGWLEIQDYGLPVRSADGTADGTDLMKWGELLCEAARNMGRPMGTDCADHYVAQMTEAGFVDINQRMFMWPSNGWPKDPLMKTLGQWNQTNILDGLEGFCLALLTRGLGWQKAEVDVFVAKVSRDLRSRKIHAYFPMPVTYARKPFPGEVPFRQ
ncbi:uncharacterized protein LTR77_001081 [Saxophila tyrrhenica]|uniref:Methyltransferase n=1 Tax=Saxophila tyrrhenica TaxID=1690608 RepID=A0AAV9PL40_9PEZI|nr:hypothetical protein LTR77_001081 [Saxophila tyrrhenica]